MSIKWFNIRSKEVRVAETEPQITAMWASSDHSPNITQGQDFGWRLAPEVVVEMKRIKQNPTILESIAARTNRPIEDIGEPEILEYISSKTGVDEAPIAQDGDYLDEYNAEIRRLEKKSDTTNDTATTTTTTTKSVAELEAELEARYKAEGKTSSTSTEAAPATTTTTTKK